MALNQTQKYFIIKDRVEIYKDFTINLLHYIIDFYLDKNTLSDDNDIKNHFNFCFNKVCDEFKKENIDFSTNEKLRDYFYEFYYHQYYKTNKELADQNITIPYYIKFWNDIFNIDKQKNKNSVGSMIELYQVFDKSINKEKNIFEFS